MICLSLADISHIPELNRIRPELVELRYDLLKEEPAEIIAQIQPGIKTLSTCRPGFYSDEQRLAILLSAIELGTNYIDIEIESGPDFVKEISKSSEGNYELIISYHNFELTPGIKPLHDHYHKAWEMGADIVKIATMVKDTDDLQALFSLYELVGKKIILGMGDLGKVTRIAAMKFGSEFTFASFSRENETAPGQLTYEEMLAAQTNI